MARMKGVPSARIGPVPPSRFGPVPFTSEAERSRYRREVHAWRKWYDDPEWRRMAWACKVAAAFTCAMCGRVASGKGQAIADHVKPHRGDRSLFFDATNLQCLCKACHDKHKQSQEILAGL